MRRMDDAAPPNGGALIYSYQQTARRDVCGGIAEAGWKGRTGCEPLEAESPYLHK